jgi:6-pyruvoyltetrahydropterin/6-carboxytetrahydropterin synthase
MSRYRITKEFHLSASHQLAGLPDWHPCGRVHGHNYIIKVTLAADTLDAHGFVLDYNDLDPLKSYLDNKFDHRHINDRVDFQPTSENLARYLYDWCRDMGWPIESVAVSETPKTWAEYRP